MDERHDALAQLARIRDLVVADFAAQRMAADDLHDRIGAFDARVNLVEPVSSTGDVFPVDPHIPPVFLEGVGQLLGKEGIAPGIGNEDISHKLFYPRSNG